MEFDIEEYCDQIAEAVRAEMGDVSIRHFAPRVLEPDARRNAAAIVDRLQYLLDNAFPDAIVAVRLDGHQRLNISIRRPPV